MENIARLSTLPRHRSKRSRIFGLFTGLGLCLSTPTLAADSDADGLDDAVDNCIEFFNPFQTDGDGDHYGDYCDGDLDNDGQADTLDFSILLGLVGADDPSADYLRDGIISTGDLDFWSSTLFSVALGPSGCADDPTSCPVTADPLDPDGDGLPDFSADDAERDLCPGFYNANDNGDADGDGIGDGCDLCMNVDDSMLPGVDSDGDGIGNACDADYDNDGFVTVSDYSGFLWCFLAGDYAAGDACAEFDSNSDGFVNVTDWALFLQQFHAGVVGVSGLPCADARAQSFVCPAYSDLYLQLAEAGTSNDLDGDGYIDIDAGGTDCDDTDDRIHPGRLDFHDDGIDSNCDGIDSDSASLADAPTTIVGTEGELEWLGYAVEHCDVDGDGLQDLLVGAPGMNDFHGGVGLWFGGQTEGWTDELRIDEADVVFAGTDKWLFGVEITCGDIDGDGWQDLAITHPEVLYGGILYEHDIAIYYGDGTRWSGDFADTEGDAILVHPLFENLTLANVFYTARVQITDVDADGAGEIIVEFDGESTESATPYEYGAAVLALAPGERYTGTQDFADIQSFEIYADESYFRGLGWELKDLKIFDVDGSPWFMLTNMGYEINRGEIILGPMPDGTAGAYPTSELEWVSIQALTRPDGSPYGTIAQLGGGGSWVEDLDGDGDLELVLTAPWLQPRNGAVAGGGLYVLESIDTTLSTWTSDPSESDAPHYHSDGEEGLLDAQAESAAAFRGDGDWSFLGYDLTGIGDVDGDGFRDILVHEGNTDLDAYQAGEEYFPFNDIYWVMSGRVMLEEGGSDMNPADAALLSFTHASPEEKVRSDVLAADFDGDGKEDMVFSTPSYADFEGRVYVYTSGLSGW